LVEHVFDFQKQKNVLLEYAVNQSPRSSKSLIVMVNTIQYKIHLLPLVTF